MKTLCLILKAPRPGAVKTRLARDIGEHKAAAIYRAMVEGQAKSIPGDWDVAVHYSPRDAATEMEEWLKPLLPLRSRFVPQCDSDLGGRLAAVVRAEFLAGADRLFLIGGDCPAVSRCYLNEAAQLLNGADVVIGPAADGGYVLLGLKAPHYRLFENITWSTSKVLNQTVAMAHALSLTLRLLAVVEDIDDVESLLRHPELATILTHQDSE